MSGVVIDNDNGSFSVNGIGKPIENLARSSENERENLDEKQVDMLIRIDTLQEKRDKKKET